MNKELNLTPVSATGPAYLQIADLLRGAIKKGQLKPGDSLPSLRDIATKVGSHRHTVMAAFHELVAEGWIESKERKNYTVTKDLPSSYFLPKKRVDAPSPKSRKHDFEIARKIETNYARTKNPELCRYNFQSGMPDLRLFPLDEFRSHLNEGLKRKHTKLLGYANPSGHPALITQLEKYLRRARGVVGRTLIVTHGSQEAIFILAQLLLKSGDTVAVEELGYPPAWDAIRSAGASLSALPIDGKGIIPEAFEKLAKTKRVRLLYTTPLHQYPTTVTMPMERRIKIYEIAKKHGCLILEDDYDHEFHYRSNPLPPMAADDPHGIILYVSTFSKILFPSSRIGFMAIPEALASHVSEFKRMTSRQNESILQEAVARWMQEGGFERHLRKMRRTYHERRDTILQSIDKADSPDMRLRVNAPDGGMAVWLDCQRDSENISDLALKKSIYVSPESFYKVGNPIGTHLRLGFANQTPTEIREGMEILLKCIS